MLVVHTKRLIISPCLDCFISAPCLKHKVASLSRWHCWWVRWSKDTRAKLDPSHIVLTLCTNCLLWKVDSNWLRLDAQVSIEFCSKTGMQECRNGTPALVLLITAWPNHYMVPADSRCGGNTCQVATLISPDSFLEGGGDLNQFQDSATNCSWNLFGNLSPAFVLCWGSGLVT